MIKNFNVPLLDAFGVQARDDESGKALTIADVAVSALTNPTPNDSNLQPAEKTNILSLAIRIGESTLPDAPDGGAREFTKDELVLIKTRAGFNCRILPFARLVQVIDSDEAKSDKTGSA